MSEHSAIQWTEATWNPITGCTKVSPGCAHCYIERTTPFRVKGRRFVDGHIPLAFHQNRLTWPHRWAEPRMIFVNSLSDLFHPDVPFSFIAEVFTTMGQTRRHTYQVLTKRPERLLAFYEWNYRGMSAEEAKADWLASWPNVWLGVSTENRMMFRKRVPILLKVPAAVRWISAEPLLEDLVDEVFTIALCSGYDTPPYDDKLDWVVLGGESGPHARACQDHWLRTAIDACRYYGTPVFVKQLGSRPSATRQERRRS